MVVAGHFVSVLHSPLVAALAGALAVLLMLAAVLRLRRWWRSRRARWRARRAGRGEERAERLLVRHGYTIEERQHRTAWTLEVDGEAHDIELRADLLVSRGGSLYVAEVKTGCQAPAITNSSTRRQLLEYLLAYGADGVLLIVPEAGEIHEVVFALPTPPFPLPAAPATLAP